MRGWVLGGLFGLGVLALAGGSARPQGKPDAGKFGWLSGFEAGRGLARKPGKPLFVVFRCEA